MWIVNHLKLSLTKPREANEINVALNEQNIVSNHNYAQLAHGSSDCKVIKLKKYLNIYYGIRHTGSMNTWFYLNFEV